MAQDIIPEGMGGNAASNPSTIKDNMTDAEKKAFDKYVDMQMQMMGIASFDDLPESALEQTKRFIYGMATLIIQSHRDL